MGGRVSTDPLAAGAWFVYRSPYEGPSGKRIWRLPDRSVLAWFQRLWVATADVVHLDADGPADDWVEFQLDAELGGPVYGLDSVFVDGHQRGLPPPATWRELRDLLDAHLYVEDEVRTSEHSVRVSTDDDEAPLQYYFVDAAIVADNLDRLAYLLHEPWELPDRSGGGEFEPGMPVRTLRPAPSGGRGATYVALLQPAHGTFHWSLRWEPFVVPGIRLPELAGWLRSVTPESFEDDDRGSRTRRRYTHWPYDLVLLRALVAPGDLGLTPAFERYNRMPLFDRELMGGDWELGEHPVVHAHTLRVLAHQGPPRHPNSMRDPSASRIRETEHLAQASFQVTDAMGHDQVYLFDDVWAAANPHLARSLLRCANSLAWDLLDDGRTETCRQLTIP
jgi:hypothetical protein